MITCHTGGGNLAWPAVGFAIEAYSSMQGWKMQSHLWKSDGTTSKGTISKVKDYGIVSFLCLNG